MRNETQIKKFTFLNGDGSCLITPINSPCPENNHKQPMEICFAANDPDGTMLDRMIRIAKSPDNVPKHVLGRLLDQLFGLINFETYGVTIIEVDGQIGFAQTIHIHTFGLVDPFDVVDWNMDRGVEKILSECKIPRS